jgi:cobalt/nickel transport system permease protein
VPNRLLDRYSRLGSPVHRRPAGVKLGVALATVLFTVSLPVGAFVPLGAVAGLLAVVTAVSRVPPGFLLRRLVLLEPLVLGASGLSLLQPGGGRVFATLAAKTTLCLLTMLLLANTTPFAEILRVMRRVRVPALLVDTVALLYRYLFVLTDEAQRMRRARASRSYRPGRWWTWRGRAALLGQLFVRSSERAERIYAAMVARGWS